MDALQPRPDNSSELLTIQQQHSAFWDLDSACPKRRVDTRWYAVERISPTESVVHDHVANDSKRVRSQNTKLNAAGGDVSFRAKYGVSSYGPGFVAFPSPAIVPRVKLRLLAAAIPKAG